MSKISELCYRAACYRRGSDERNNVLAECGIIDEQSKIAALCISDIQSYVFRRRHGAGTDAADKNICRIICDTIDRYQNKIDTATDNGDDYIFDLISDYCNHVGSEQRVYAERIDIADYAYEMDLQTMNRIRIYCIICAETGADAGHDICRDILGIISDAQNKKNKYVGIMAALGAVATPPPPGGSGVGLTDGIFAGASAPAKRK